MRHEEKALFQRCSPKHKTGDKTHFSSFFSAAAAAFSALSEARLSCSRARSALRKAVSAACSIRYDGTIVGGRKGERMFRSLTTGWQRKACAQQ